MNSDNRLIKKMFRGILLINTMSILSGVACLMIDAIITGQFLGVDAVTASGLVRPIVMITNLIGDLSGLGVGIVCARYMGMAKPQRANQVFSIVVISTLAVGLLMTGAMYIFAPGISNLLGAKTENTAILNMMTDYMRGYSLGLVPMRFVVMLLGIMMLDNDKNRGVIAMASILVADIAFDLLSVLVFDGGMYGMALASSASNLVGFLVIMMHFFKKNRLLHFTFKGLKMSDMKDVFLAGVPSAITMGSQALKGLCFNILLISIAGESAVAALTVGMSSFVIVSSVTVGIFNSTSVLTSLLYGEEDRLSLKKAFGVAVKYAFICYSVMMVFVLIFAYPLATLFLNTTDTSILNQSAAFIRFMGIQNLFMIFSFPLSGAYQGTRKLSLNYTIDIMREAVFPIACVTLLGLLIGINAVGYGFIAAGFFTLLLCILIPTIKQKRIPKNTMDFLLIPEGFGAKPEETFETTMRTLDDVMSTCEKVSAFVSERGADSKTSNLITLFVEEMGTNITTHGYAKGKSGSSDLKIIYRKDSCVMRFRDDGKSFNPLEWIKTNADDVESGIGIKMLVGLAKDVKYYRAMELNNLVIFL